MWFVVDYAGCLFMGTPADLYSEEFFNARAQKWGGVQKNIMQKSKNKGLLPFTGILDSATCFADLKKTEQIEWQILLSYNAILP